MTVPPLPQRHPLAVPGLVLAFLFPPLGIALGAIAKGEIDQFGGAGRGVATAALVLGFVLSAVWAALAIWLVAGLLLAG